jgi:exodeoxyribonuclease VII large subunit
VGFVRSATQLSASAKNAEPISVSELNRRVKGLLEANFELRWVRGELSNVMRAASGHWYFSLKDDSAQVRCVMFRHRAQSVAFTPENGIEVDIRALPSLYEARGEFQLGVEAMRRAGVGALFEAFERLKRKLAAEGLFDEARKRVLPDFPRTVGIVTSTKAAALRDVLATFKRRAPMVNIIIYPTAVQGADAAREIAAAIDIAAKRHEVEALLICRGGGAAEDLWSFNEEVVARALARFQTETHIPVVSGVGHETDFTICDFVADVRAPTPTAAAELLSPDMAAMRLQLTQQASQLLRSTTRVLGRLQQRLDLAARGLLSPEQRIQRERELLNQFAGRLSRGLQWAYASQRQRFLQQRSRLLANAPDIRQRREHLKSATASVDRAVATALSTRRTALAQHAQALLLLNPEHVLLRGYAMVTRPTTEGGAVGSVMSAVVTSSAQLKPADRVTLRFHDGKADAEIK